MAKSYSIQCEHCEKDVEFEIDEVPDLEDYHNNQIDLAEQNMRREVEGEFEGYVEPEAVIDGQRTLFELSAAIRRGDRPEAEMLLDRISEHFGDRAVEQVQQGRFSNRAKVAA